MNDLFQILNTIDDALWSYAGFTLVALLGLYFSIRFRFAQATQFPKISKLFFDLMGKSDSHADGVHPLKAFFTSIGGCIGIGNLVAVCTAVQIGGPGAVFWMWIAAFLGTTLKYGEVFLGVKYRVHRADGTYAGGPMFFLGHVFKSPVIPTLAAVFLCIYGTEVYMFNVVTQSIVANWNANHFVVIVILLVAILYAAVGGVDRVGEICSVIIPIFVVLFLGMGGYVLMQHLDDLIPTVTNIFTSAFTGHAAMGGFAGSGMILAISQGMARGCYTGDIGVGFASVIHAQTKLADPKKQAALVILGIFLDTFVICTLSTLLILVTGLWSSGLDASLLIQTVLAEHFPAMNIFMPIFLIILGYSSMISFFTVGIECSRYLSPNNGKKAYFAYASLAFVIFSFLPTAHALTIMSLSGGFLLILNAYGIWKLRHEIELKS